jgi:hypothetical protein
MDKVCPTCEALRRRVAELEAQLAEALRAGKRQAAPFAKGPPKAEPKKSGRKPGKDYGRNGHRPPPPPLIDEVHEAPLPDACPDCGGPVQETDVQQQYQVEILRKVWGGNRTWRGARAQSVLMSFWRRCWQQGRRALDSLSGLLRGQPVLLVQPP